MVNISGISVTGTALMLVILVTGCGSGGTGTAGGGSGPGTPPPNPPSNPIPYSSNTWTWADGSKTANQPGNYGIKGVASASNLPGARYAPAAWTDLDGNFWLFGGFGLGENDTAGALNDLWEYTNEEWTWIGGSSDPGQAGVYGTQGVTAAGNVPGARQSAVTWTNKSGDLWLFGGIGRDSVGTRGDLNDLWKYDPKMNEWTWVKGSKVAAEPGIAGAYQGAGVYGTKGVSAPGNLPGARFDASGWVDASGNLWLFGGDGVDANGQLGNLNDLWRYTPSTNEWTWMSGSDTISQNGVYGTKGVAAAANVPGARFGAVTWTDASGNLWLFGGDGNDAVGCHDSLPPCELNDLWKYDPSTNEWTWVGGSTMNNQAGVYGTQGIAAPGNIPPPRDSAVGWTDTAGNFWLFGGLGPDDLGDLWKYSNGEWTWMSGSDSSCPASSYGTQGVPVASNEPGGRNGSVGWIDKSGNLWLFGGEDTDCIDSLPYNDLWEYQP